MVRTKENILLQRRYSLPVDNNTGVRSDQTVILTAIDSAEAYPDALRRVSYYDADTGEDPDLDCRVGLCPGGDHPQATGAGCESLPNSLDASLYQILQILSITLFEKVPILQALQASDSQSDLLDPGNQLNLFDS